jgi:transposase-like protein
MNTELIRKLAGTNTTVTIEVLGNVLLVESKMRVVKMKESQELKRHKEVLDEIDKERLQIQCNLCMHDAETYHPDPSGGSDSSYVCDICGRER